MKILLIHPNPRKINVKTLWDAFAVPVLPPLGLLYLASCVEKNGHEVKILDAYLENLSEKEVFLKIKKFMPDVVGFSIFRETFSSARIAQNVKELNPLIVTVTGGINASLIPHLLLERFSVFDFVIIGEGEITFPALIQALDNKNQINQISGIAYRYNGNVVTTPKQEGIENLDSLPFPARHLIENSVYGHFGKKPMTLIETTRGCIGNCRFCPTRNILGNKIRARNPLRVVDEMEECYYKYNIDYFAFIDSTFTADKNHVYKITDEMIKRKLHKKIRWRCVTRVDCVDGQILKEMKEAGCKEIGFGVESYCQDILDFYCKEINLKQTEDAFVLSRRAGISPFALMIINQFDQNFNIVEKRNIEFIKRLKADYVTFQPLTIYPGTNIYYTLLSRGDLKNEDITPYLQGFYFESKYLNLEGIIKLKNRMYLSFYINKHYLIVLFKSFIYWWVMRKTQIYLRKIYFKAFKPFIKQGNK